MVDPRQRPLVVVALGGNALLRRGQPLDHATQRANAQHAARALAELSHEVDVVITHGNGPQVGMLAQQQPQSGWPLDVLVAQTQGMIGYALALEFDAAVGPHLANVVLTRVVVDEADPAFAAPSKPIGPLFTTRAEFVRARADSEWSGAPDGDGWRRTVASPAPVRIMELEVIREIVARGRVPICCGGGGIPVAERDGRFHGVEAVIDKDATSALLAEALDADALLLLTDVDGVYEAWGTATARRVPELAVDANVLTDFAGGSMRPKLAAAMRFAAPAGRPARIGRLEDARAIWHGDAGTRIRAAVAAHAT